MQYKTSTDASHNLQVNVSTNGKKKEYGFFDFWKKDPSIRIYDKIVFKPTPLKALPTEYNSFQGFPILKGKKVPIPERTN